VIIHGHTDIIGSEEYSNTLSESRATQTQKIIEPALNASGKKNVSFQTIGYSKYFKGRERFRPSLFKII